MLLPLAVVQRQPFRIMIDDAYSFLQNYNSSEDNVDHNVECVMETAKLLLGAINRDPAHFQRLTEPATDVSLVYGEIFAGVLICSSEVLQNPSNYAFLEYLAVGHIARIRE